MFFCLRNRNLHFQVGVCTHADIRVSFHVLEQVRISLSGWRLRLRGSCDQQRVRDSDGCKLGLSLNGAVFLFMKDWSSRRVPGTDEICMQRPYCSRLPHSWFISAEFCAGSPPLTKMDLTLFNRSQEDGVHKVMLADSSTWIQPQPAQLSNRFVLQSPFTTVN